MSSFMLSSINSLHYSWWYLTCLSSMLTRYITTHLSDSWPAFVSVTHFCGAQCRIFTFLSEFWAGRAGMSNLKEKEWFFSLWPPFTWNVMFKRTGSRPAIGYGSLRQRSISHQPACLSVICYYPMDSFNLLIYLWFVKLLMLSMNPCLCRWILSNLDP